MASSIGRLTSLDEPQLVEPWIQCFAAEVRATKLKENQVRGEENEITDQFLASAVCEAIMKIAIMVNPKQLENLTFAKFQKL